ncbi:hypothetical protein NDU88_006524 [Pleurodeles waltl]|uniref:Uncharacterized protein n=1 Tax=Pleurodeles waltl TaxID=8319 RepID=A0AAV7PJ30_PLEWA|nr:hypothetical protein NDU88_006524 [Pleurodeles waltl]
MTPFDGPVGDGPCSIVTGANPAPGTPEQPGAGPNQESSAAVTWRGRGGNRTSGEEKTPMSEEDERGGEEEEEDGDVDEPCLPRKTEEDKEVAAGEWNTAAAPGCRAKNPAMLLEKRGLIRCVSPPH